MPQNFMERLIETIQCVLITKLACFCLVYIVDSKLKYSCDDIFISSSLKMQIADDMGKSYTNNLNCVNWKNVLQKHFKSLNKLINTLYENHMKINLRL